MTTVDDLKHLSAHQLREIAVRAEVDPRTVQRLIDGLHVRGMQAQRIRRAMEDLGLATREISTAPSNKEGGR